jgi:hypothetical protein
LKTVADVSRQNTPMTITARPTGPDTIFAQVPEISV